MTALAATKGRVLVVDDELIVALDLQERLTQLGYSVVATVGTADEAVASASALKPELVLMDIRLKGGDGIDAAAAIRRERAIPIVFLTAFADDETVARAKRVRPDGYLIKPFEDRELQVVLELALFKHRAERDLAAREALFQTVLQSLGEAVVAIAADGTIQSFNPAAAALVGLEESAAVGRPAHEVLRFEGPPHELVLRDRLGSPRAIERTSRPLPIYEGLAGGEVLVLRDVSAARLEEARKSLTARVSDALAAASDEAGLIRAVAAQLASSVCDWCVIDLLGAGGAVAETAFAQAEAFRGPSRLGPLPVGRRHHQLTEVLLEPAAGSPLASALGLSAEDEDEAEAFSSRAVLSLPVPGSQGPLGKMSLGLRAPGRRLGVEAVGHLRDLAKRLGGALEKAQLYRATAAAVRSRDDVLAIVSHDLRNPLATIRIGLDALRASAAGADPSVSRKLTMMVRAAARMRRLIADLLDVATIDSGTLSFQSHRESLHGILQEVQESHAPQAKERGLEFAVSAPQDDLALHCDRERIEQALGNVIGNALKFTPPGGRVTLSAQVRPGEVELIVADTGIGISPDQLPRIFLRRWQAPHPGAPHLGSGLGLYITRGIVEGQGGRIWAESTPGKGTAFHLVLPAPSIDAGRDAASHAPS